MWRIPGWRRKVDPTRETQQFFEDVEWMRRSNFNTHQAVRLTGTDMVEPGIQPTPAEMEELRTLLASVRRDDDVHSVPRPLFGYAGFTLYDPLDDDERPQDLSEFADFSPARKIREIYHVYGGTVELQGEC